MPNSRRPVGIKKRKKRKISVQAGKAKGRRLQQWAAKWISVITNIPWGKDELIASREMGQSGVDVRLIGEARKLFPFSVECKNCEKWSIHDWIKQAQDNQMPKTEWLLIAKRNHTDPVAIMDADKFMAIIGNLLEMHRRFGGII